MPRFNREEIEKYYEVLGVNPNEEGLIIGDSVNLHYIDELYELNEFEKKLSYTAKELSNNYSLLMQIIMDGFWYNSKKRRENATASAFEVLDDLTKFDIDSKDNEELTIDRRNNLKSTIIKGLCEVGDIIDFRLYQKNVSFNAIFNKITNIENEENCKKKLGYDEDFTPEDTMKLYYLIAYSKFQNDGSDFEMFDGVGKVSLRNLRHLVKRGVNESIPISENNQEREKVENPKILRLSHFQKNINKE